MAAQAAPRLVELNGSAAEPMALVLRNREEAFEAAEALARLWSVEGPAIDRDGTVPRAPLQQLSRSGLLAVTVPREFGGTGLTVSDLMEIFFILAGADLALAQVPQNHFDFVDALEQAEPETRAFFYAELLKGARFGNALAEPGRKSRRDLATTITETEGGYRLTGRKFYATGALTADWVPVHAKAGDDRILTAYIHRQAEGLTVLDDWNAFGQRATFSGTVILENVFVPAEHVVDRASGDRYFVLAQYAGNQLIHPALEAGAARGAAAMFATLLASAGIPNGSPAWAVVGRLPVKAEAAQTLVRRAARLTDHALAARTPTRDQALAAVTAVDVAKSLAYETGPEVTAALLSAHAPAAASASLQLDRLWRNARTHSLHDPVRWRQHQAGDLLVNGRLSSDLAARFGISSTLQTETPS